MRRTPFALMLTATFVVAAAGAHAMTSNDGGSARVVDVRHSADDPTPGVSETPDATETPEVEATETAEPNETRGGADDGVNHDAGDDHGDDDVNHDVGDDHGGDDGNDDSGPGSDDSGHHGGGDDNSGRG